MVWHPLIAGFETFRNVSLITKCTLTVEDINAQSLADFETEKSDYTSVLSKSEAAYDELLANHEEEVKKAEARYDKEMKDFKSFIW